MVVKTNKIKFDSDKTSDVIEGEGVFDLGNLTAKSALMYKRKKDVKITSIQLFRRPVEDALTGAMDALTGNAVSKFFKSTSHDQLFHLGLIINGKFLYHKQANIAIEQMPSGFRKGKKIELKPVTGFDGDLTFKDMYRRTRDKVGEKKFYAYDSFKNNCQDFIINTLDTIGATYDRDWVKQDVKEIVKNAPDFFPGLAKAITDTASVAEKIVGGGEPVKRKRGRPKKETTEVKKKGRPRKKKEEDPFVITDRRHRPDETRDVAVQGAGLDSAMIDKIVEKVMSKLKTTMDNHEKVVEKAVKSVKPPKVSKGSGLMVGSSISMKC